MSNRRRGPRLGLDKPRDIERRLAEAAWHDKGAATGSTNDKAGKMRRSMVLAASAHHGVDLTDCPVPSRNPVADGLLLLKLVTGNVIFERAFEELRRLGLDGPDFDHKLSAMLPVGDNELGLRATIDNALTAGASLEQALERAAVELEVPSSSFDGAVQSLKRERKKATKKPMA
jgi:hypothetical protein